MLQRFLAILLTLAMPVQGFAASHSHGPMAGTQPNDHHQRPHLHLGDHHHHHHGHSRNSCPCDNRWDKQNALTLEPPSPPSHHDDDALYVSGNLGLNPTPTDRTVADDGLLLWVEIDQSTAINTCSSVEAAPNFLARGATPIYLATLSLRL